MENGFRMVVSASLSFAFSLHSFLDSTLPSLVTSLYQPWPMGLPFGDGQSRTKLGIPASAFRKHLPPEWTKICTSNITRASLEKESLMEILMENVTQVKIQAGDIIWCILDRGLTTEQAPNQLSTAKSVPEFVVDSAYSKSSFRHFLWNIFEPGGTLMHAIHRSHRWWGHLHTFRTSFPSRFLDSRLLFCS